MASALTAAFVRTITKPGKYGDQHGLILRVSHGESKQWVWRGTIRGKRVDLGLGGWPYVSLAEARQIAFDHRKVARAGGDPLALRRKPEIPTFAEAMEEVIKIHEPNWKHGTRSAKLWRSSLGQYALPRLGRKRVSDINTADVLAVLIPLWADKRNTGRCVRQRIGSIMKWAVAKGYRSDNPAGDAIGAALPKNGVARRHMLALPHSEVAGAVAKIRESGEWVGTTLALEFLILTAARSGEVRGAQWSEIDLGARTWTVPGERMKAGRPHRVPLSARALEVLNEARRLSGGSGLIFPSVTGRGRMADATLSEFCRERRLGCVPHGFRSSFRDWAAECSDAPREVCELALAHVNKDRVESAYMRSDLFERRRELMEAWARYLGGCHE